MKKANIIRVMIYSLAIILPIIATFNCSGWGTNDMKVDQCIVDTPFLREASETCYSVLFFSCFLFGIPIALYAAIILAVTEGPIFLITKINKALK